MSDLSTQFQNCSRQINTLLSNISGVPQALQKVGSQVPSIRSALLQLDLAVNKADRNRAEATKALQIIQSKLDEGSQETQSHENSPTVTRRAIDGEKNSLIDAIRNPIATLKELLAA